MTVRVALPRVSRMVALERPIENPSGENVNWRREPARETRCATGPASDQLGVVRPRRRMVRVRESTESTVTILWVTAISRARWWAAARWLAAAATSMRSSAAERRGTAMPRRMLPSARTSSSSGMVKACRMTQNRQDPYYGWHRFCAWGGSKVRASSASAGAEKGTLVWGHS